MRRLVLALVLTLAACGPVAGAAAEPAATAERPSHKPDVRYDPSPPRVVRAMLNLAGVTAADVVYDLGSGDGRVPIAAATDHGARGVGIEIDPKLVARARANAERAGVADRVTFRQGDLFKADIGDATVVTLFLSPTVNLELRSKLLAELKPGTRVVSHYHDMGDWEPARKITVDYRPVYLWIVPGALPEK
jgi:SAM-dependent methyltransferase